MKMFVYHSVCQSLVSRGEKQDEETISGRKRMDLIHTLCDMNPCEALFVRSICVSFPCSSNSICTFFPNELFEMSVVEMYRLKIK
jgi:hypothetical protein